MRNGRTWRALCAALLCLALLSGMLATTAEDLALPEDGIAVNAGIEGDIGPMPDEGLDIPELDLDIDLFPEDGLVLDSDAEEIALPSGPDEGVDGNAEEDSAGEYVITFVNDDGTVLWKKEDYKYNDKVEYGGTLPTKGPDATHYYEFTGWVDTKDTKKKPTVYANDQLPNATASVTYKAKFTAGKPVTLVATYTGEPLTKVYDCNKYGAYSKDGQVVYIIEALKTIKEKFKLDLAKGRKWIDGHKSIGFKLSLSKQFSRADVGNKYKFYFKVELTGDDAAYYKLKNRIIKVPAAITPREVVVTPRAGLSKTYGTADPKYPDGTWLSNDETSPLHQDLSGVPGYGVPVNMQDGKLSLSVTEAAYLMQEARLKGTKFFPGKKTWLTREKGEEVGKYKILIGGMKFGKNFTVKLKDEVFTITAKNPADSNIIVKAIPNQQYTGRPITLDKEKLVVTYGNKTLKEGRDFTTEYKDNIEASTDYRMATVTLTGKGNYTGTREVTFNIIQSGGGGSHGGDDSGIHISSVSVDPIPDQAYTGKAIKPSPVLRYNGKRLKKGSDYTLSYENNVRIGTATITVTGKGFFTGTTWLSFNIVPRSTRFTKGTGLKKAVRLEWKKVSGVSGYDIQYTSEDHQAGGGFVVSYPTQTQYTLSNLAAGKTYTFTIRTFVTVGGQNYYSPWSRAIKVKTK